MRDRPRLHLRRESEADERAIQFLKELVAATPTQRNWRGILISLLVIGLVSSLIVTCVILLTPPDLGPRIRGHLLTLEDVVRSTYSVQSDSAAWVNDEEISYRDDDGGVSVFNVRTRSTRVLVSNITMRQTRAERFLVSPDLLYVLLIEGRETKMSEYMGEARCWLLHVDRGHVTALKPEPWSADRSHPPLQHVAWVPRGGAAAGDNNALLMVHRGNVFYKERALSTDSYSVTSDGQPGLVFNGAPDLLYAEHILRSDHAIWPSPGGDLLLYFIINCTAVMELQYTEYGSGPDPSYPRVLSVRYPRAGAVNPTLAVTIANVSNPEQISYHTVKPPAPLADGDLYAAGVSWLDDSRVSVTWYNRRQNISYVTVCSAPSWHCQTVYQSQAELGWVEVTDGPVFSSDKRSALLLDRMPDGPDGFFSQILMVDIARRSVTQMTQERADVTKILAWDEGYIYYLSEVEGAPGQIHLHRTSDHSSPLKRTARCLTCPPDPDGGEPNATDSDPEPCLQHEAVFSPAPAGGRYALRCLGPAVPRLTVAAAGAAPAQLLLNNTRLRAGNLSLPDVRLLAVPLAAGRTARVRLLVPPQYRDGDAVAFPLLVRLAGGRAEPRWAADWPAYLASRQGLVVASVQLPGQPSAADERHLPPDQAVGAQDVQALLAVVTHLTTKLEFVSPLRVIAVGHGYGAYLALSLLAQTEKQLRCAVAIAPITSWELYASAASERRLGRPADNHRGYSDSALGRRAPALAGRRLLLVHGTADTSVGVQHTFLLARRLERAGAVFRQMVYPDEGHQLKGVAEHLYRTLDQYFHECFLPDNVKELIAEDI